MIKKLASEVIRRGVLKALGAYLAILWLLAQGVVDIFPALGVPEWIVRTLLIIGIAAIPVIALVSWKYDLTRKGLLRDRGGSGGGSGRFAAVVTGGPTRRSNMLTRSMRSTVRVGWTGPDGRPHEETFNTQFIVGRDAEADVQIADERVSRRHIKVYPRNGEWFVKDLSSLNGSYIDAQQIDEKRIDSDTSVSLDKGGPVVRLSTSHSAPTRLTVRSP